MSYGTTSGAARVIDFHLSEEYTLFPWEFCLHVCLFTTYVVGAWQGLKRVPDPLDLDRQPVVSHRVEAVNQTWVLHNRAHNRWAVSPALIFNLWIFLRDTLFKFTEKLMKRCRNFDHIPCPSPCAASLVISIPARVVTWWLHQWQSLSPSIAYLCGDPCVGPSITVNKHIRTCT